MVTTTFWWRVLAGACDPLDARLGYVQLIVYKASRSRPINSRTIGHVSEKMRVETRIFEYQLASAMNPQQHPFLIGAQA
jgi:hypothetical protein